MMSLSHSILQMEFQELSIFKVSLLFTAPHSNLARAKNEDPVIGFPLKILGLILP